MATSFVERARALVGTRFRPQGRDAHGLDCVGLVLATFQLPVEAAPRNYALRGNHRANLEGALNGYFRRVPRPQLRAGDVMVMQVAPDQLHLGIRTPDGFVHAHAGIRRVVEAPALPEWPLIAVYRKRRTA